MRNTARRLTKLEQTAQATAIIRDASSTLVAIEAACSDGRTEEATVILEEYIETRIAEYRRIEHAHYPLEVWLVLYDPVLRRLSFNTFAKIFEHSLAHTTPEAGPQEFEEVTMRNLIPRTPSEKTKITIRVPTRLRDDPEHSHLFKPGRRLGDVERSKRKADSET